MLHLPVILSILLVSAAANSDADDERDTSEIESSTTEIGSIEAHSSREEEILENKEFDHQIEVSRKKVKLKKKHKKYLLEIVMAGMLIKSALLPLAVGFLKLLTGKALILTMMALGLVSVLTFRGATEHKEKITTEIINLAGPGHGHHKRSLPEHFPELLATQILKKWQCTTRNCEF